MRERMGIIKKVTIEDRQFDVMPYEPPESVRWRTRLRRWAKAHEGLLTVIGMAVAALALFWALTGCASPTASKPSASPTPTPTTKTVTVKNSLWQDVPLTTVVSKSVLMSRATAVSDSELLDAVTQYNDNTLDDFLRVYYTDAPSIEDSPPVDVFIVRPIDYHVNMAQTGIARSLLVDNAAGWRQDAYGQILFIDHVPPAPGITPPTSMYAFYAIYEVDNITGAILLEDHCGYNADESFTGQWITTPESQGGGGWSSIDAYYVTTLNAYTSDSQVTALHKHVVANHALYVPPTP